MSDIAKLIERLRKRAKEDQDCAGNSAVIVDALSDQMKRFEDRDDQGWNTYAVRMAVDHKNSVKKDTQYASDLLEATNAIDHLTTLLDEAASALEGCRYSEQPLARKLRAALAAQKKGAPS